MNKIFMLTLCTTFLMTACSQSENRVPFYKYDGRLRKENSLGVHTLQKGETLWTVAKSYRVDLRDMLDLNKLNAPYKIHTGQRIVIPAPANYKVRAGDTLYTVSRMFATTTTELAQMNNIRAPYVLSAGQTLRLPPLHQSTTFVTTPVTQPVTQSEQPVRAATIEREALQPITSSPAHQSVVVSAPPSVVQKQTDSSVNRPLTGNPNFIKPVSGQIISGYGAKPDGLHNDGINIKAMHGDAVRAAERGVIVYSGHQIEGYGNMVLIRHAGGYLTAYAHMDKILVKKGDVVKRGQSIGTVGSTGNVKTPQLHFEIRKGRDAIDPKTLLGI